MREIKGERYRISILTDRLVRLEYNEDGIFEDRMTQMVTNRNFADADCKKELKEGRLVIETKDLRITYDGEEFSTNGLSILVKSNGNTWHYSVVYANSDMNLLGTARTLDLTDGYVELDNGIFGRYGYAVIDDSRSPVFENGEFTMRSSHGKDLYFFGYGKDYYGGLRDFYQLCGSAPMIPRYALGNWWSRYYRYTESSYNELLDRFEEEKIPISVAVIDMDWHLTEVDSRYGTGWTGYTWDKECFPDHKRFLSGLKERRLAATLNLHPADGIRGFEEMYPAVAERMGIDPESEKAVEHDFSDPKYREAYFEEVIHPYEDDGVDFWWIDWQQGTGRDENEVDPLLLLNHYHYEDNRRNGKRPMVFSRYAGPGSHRYPIGFSGDTFTSWKSLTLQPGFTSTASNIGYGWWSHDIGGHMQGDKDNERLIRWTEYGIFSPIMRIHSSKSPFSNKEPWALEEPYHGIMAEQLRLRHRLIPYIYSESYRAYKDGVPVISPMYYRHPDSEEAYTVPNEYYFGSRLCVCAITEPEDKELKMASVNAFIPKGRWYDIFNGRIYESDGCLRKLYRPLESIPTLIAAGGIVCEAIPDHKNGTDNPDGLRVLIGGGADGSYTLYEDDGVSEEYLKGDFCTTKISVKWNDPNKICIVNIAPSEGDIKLIPGTREFEIELYGVGADAAVVSSDSDIQPDISYDDKMKKLTVSLSAVSTQRGVSVRIEGIYSATNDVRSQIFEIIDRAWIELNMKETIYSALNSCDEEEFLSRLFAMGIPEVLKDAIREVQW